MRWGLQHLGEGQDGEGQDYVVCRECGHQAAKLYRHVEKHGGVKAYQARHGADVPLRCAEAKARQDHARTTRLAALPPTWAETKSVACPSCGVSHLVGKQMGRLHDLRCGSCKATPLPLWEGKVEGQDFVTCVECGHRAENLTSHVTNAHPNYRRAHPDAPLVALCSSVRDKTSLRGGVLSDATKARMSANAGRWNAGLTKGTDERVARMSASMRGRASWRRGLTKETDPRVAAATAKMQDTITQCPRPESPLKANLTTDDFEQYLDVQGAVDRRAAEKGLGYSGVTLVKYMGKLGLRGSRKYLTARAEAATIRLDKEAFAPYTLANGKVSIGAAMSGLGHSFPVVVRECARHGLPTFHRRIRQTLCLDAVSEAMGGVPYTQEWKTWQFVNHRTGHRFRFDGYYKSAGLIVEFHGHQHYTFPNAFMTDESKRPLWEAMCWRDAEKERLVREAGMFYLAIREDEPFTDPAYLAGRLVQAGVLVAPLPLLDMQKR